MSRILCIETTTKNCSVSLTRDGISEVSRQKLSPEYEHAEILHVFIKQVLDEADCTVKNLDAVAVSKGPGSYTGLRIGVSAAKGICFAGNIPLIALETLKILFLQAKEKTTQKDLYIPMLDARRMEVYTCSYDFNGARLNAVSAQIIDQSFFDQLQNTRLVIFGDGAEKCSGFLKPEHIIIEGLYPSAMDMAALAYEQYGTGIFENLAYFEPYYLKDFLPGIGSK